MELERYTVIMFNISLNNNLASLIENKRVVMIGPSPHLTGSKLGNYIDRHDTVCRINDVMPPPDLRGDYGSRTDILFHNFGTVWMEGLREKISYGDIPENHRSMLLEIACFDILANNADRKAMHCFIGVEGRVWGIDHGLTFHHHLKLRTAIWDFWGEKFPVRVSKSLEKLMVRLKRPRGKIKELVGLLEPIEVEALKIRLNWLMELNAYPTLR